MPQTTAPWTTDPTGYDMAVQGLGLWTNDWQGEVGNPGGQAGDTSGYTFSSYDDPNGRTTQYAKDSGGNIVFQGGYDRNYTGSSLGSLLRQGARDLGPFAAQVAGSAAGGYLPNFGELAGISTPGLQSIFNSALGSGATAALSGGDIGKSMVYGSIPSLASYFGPNLSGTNMSDPFNKNMTNIPGLQQTNVGDITGMSPQQSFAPWSGNSSISSLPSFNQEKQSSLFESSGLQGFFDNINGFLPSTQKGWGDMAQGLLGMWQGNKQRKTAKGLLDTISGRRGSYETSLRNQLQARDAASGRRSNYAGRETELQGNLAKLDAGNAPMMAQLQTMQNSGLFNMLSSGLRWGGKSGLFGDSYNPNVPTPQFQPNSMPSFSLGGMGSNPLVGVSSPLTGTGDNYSSPLEAMFRKLRGGY